MGAGDNSRSKALRVRQRGFAMAIFLVILVLGVVFATVSQLELASRPLARGETSLQVLNQAKEALVGYAATYRDSHAGEVHGYLPCPDTDGDGIAEPSCGATGEAAVGLLPYRTLGLADLRDSDAVCLWYAVAGAYKNNPKATAAMNWDTQGQFAIAGTTVAPEAGDGGGAAVIFAAGAALAGQNRTPASNRCGMNPAEVAAYLDAGNAFVPGSAAITLTPGTDGSASNNDRMLAVTPRDIFDRVSRRNDFVNAATASPPGQVNVLTEQIKVALEKKIQADLLAGNSQTNCATGTLTSLPGNCASYTQQSGKWIGDVTTGLAVSDTGYTNYLANWAEQYRQAISSSLTTSLNINGTGCRGALLFAGRNASGQPRLTAQKAPSTANLDHYFDAGSGGARDLLNSATTAFTGAAAYSGATPAADVGTCLFPGAFVSFARDMASFQAGTVTSGTALAAVNTTAKTLTLGSTAGGAGSSCSWYPGAVPMGSMLRLYFRVQFLTKGNGFTLTIADAATNNPANTNPVMCGNDASSSRLGYAGSPNGITVGIQRPKLGIEFDTRYNSSRDDPHRDHTAFLFWGTSGDSLGDDDNTHYAGTGGSAITTASQTGIFTTASAHGFSTGQIVVVSGVSPATYNGTYTIVATPATNQFSVALASVPVSGTGGTVRGISSGSQPRNPRVATAMRSPDIAIDWAWCGGGTVTIDTSGSHNFSVGQKVYVTGMSPGGYNGLWTISAIPSSDEFRYTVSACPAAVTSTGTVVQGSDIATLSWSGVAAATTPAAHGLSSGLTHGIYGVTPSGYHQTGPITSTGASSFTYADGNPGGTFSAESPPGMALLKSTDDYLPYDGFPLNLASTPVPCVGTCEIAKVVHVRLDIARSYDAANSVAILNMKGYIGDTFPLVDACGAADFQDLSRNLADICPNRTVTIAQEGIPVANVSGPALANVYVGFTTARRSTDSGENQSVVISNLQMRSQ